MRDYHDVNDDTVPSYIRRDNKYKAGRKERVEKAFGQIDKIVRISSSYKDSIKFLREAQVLAPTPKCEKCDMKMEFHIASYKQGF